MPIQRRDDGEVVVEATEPVGRSSPSGTGQPSSDAGVADAPTDPLKSGGKYAKTEEDSLFKPKRHSDDAGNRMEEPTVPIGSDHQDDKTRIISPRRSGTSQKKQPVPDPTDPMLDPPVGWLVVVRGPGKGQVLTLGNGMNIIGRGPDARVRIDFGDATIARTNHARLVYEPRQRHYLLNHGDGTNLTYLNGEVVIESTAVESGAMIEIGETTLRFLAFCSADFDWLDIDD